MTLLAPPLARRDRERGLFQGRDLSARLAEGGTDRVVVCFPDRVHPTGPHVPGWGEGFLSKRGISGVFISCAEINWFQTPEFFDAMAAIRTALGGRPVTTYGSSMGGYAALLGARALGADRALALVPQVSIDPAVVPFETRYDAYASKIGPFLHDLADEIAAGCSYTVGLDPTHRLDRKHFDRIAAVLPVSRLPIYGAGHGCAAMIAAGPGKEALAGFLMGKVTHQGLRRAVRTGRAGSRRYRRRVGRIAMARGHAVPWPVKTSPPVVSAPRPRLVIHAGPPATGAAYLQDHFHANADHYRAHGVAYPAATGYARDGLSMAARGGDTGPLAQILAGRAPDCAALLLSDDTLYVEAPGISAAASAALHRALAGFDVTLIVARPDMPDWKHRFYLQAIHTRRAGRPKGQASARSLWQTPLSFEAFFDQPYMHALLDIDVTCDGLQRSLAARRVCIADPATVIVDTCAALGLAPPDKNEVSRHHPRLTDVEGEILRQANGLGSAEGRLMRWLIATAGSPRETRARAARVMAMAQVAESIDWARFRHVPNPPLDVSRAAFEEKLGEVRAHAARLTAAKAE